MSYYSKDDKYYMDFKDEEGKKITLEVIAEIHIDEIKYLILGIEDDSEDSYVVREDLVEDSIEYNFIDNEEEFLKVKKQYKKMIYG